MATVPSVIGLEWMGHAGYLGHVRGGSWGCAKFMVDLEQTKLRQMSLKELSWLFLGLVKGVLD